jgi:hypothetical protein
MWRYRSISSERQRPRRRILSVSTSAQRRAIVPPERSDLAEMSSGRKPKSGPRAVMAMRREAVIRAGVTLNHAEYRLGSQLASMCIPLLSWHLRYYEYHSIVMRSTSTSTSSTHCGGGAPTIYDSAWLL